MRWSTVCVLAAALALGGSALASDSPQLVATLTNRVALKQYRAGALIPVRFTVGEAGQPPGTGVPAGSAFQVQLLSASGLRTPLTVAAGANGHYRVSIRWPGGRLARVRVLAYLSSPGTAMRGFWLRVKRAP